MKSISVLFPSRGRPERAAAAFVSAFATASHPERVTGLLMVDRDDAELSEYLFNIPERVSVYINDENLALQGRGAPALYNRLALEHGHADILVAAGDDVLFRTSGWDDALEGASRQWNDGLFFAFFNDGRDRDKAEHFAVSSAWVAAVGYLMWPDYRHFCADEHVEDIACRVGRRAWLRDYTLEHMHAKYGKAEKDATYYRIRSQDLSTMDIARFNRLGEEREAAAARVQAAIAAFTRAAA